MRKKEYVFLHAAFAEKIEGKGKSKADLARLLGVAPQSIDYDKDGKQPHKDKVGIIAKYLGCKKSDISDLEDEAVYNVSSVTPLVNVTATPNSPVINVQLNARQLDLLQVFGSIPDDAQLDAVNLLHHYGELPREKRKELLVCALQGKTCLDIKSEIKSEVKKEVAAVAKDCPPAGHGCPEEKAS